MLTYYGNLYIMITIAAWTMFKNIFSLVMNKFHFSKEVPNLYFTLKLLNTYFNYFRIWDNAYPGKFDTVRSYLA